MRLRAKILAVAAAAVTAAAAAVLAATPASAATLTEVTNFGTNPSNLRMHLYVPDRVATRPGIVVALHYCTGTGPVFYNNTQYASLADRYGFIVIYPTANRSSQCFDVYSQQALTRSGSDPVGIRSMVS
jgi:acetylxylan esterase